MTDKRNRRREARRKVHDRREGTIRGGDRRNMRIHVLTDRRSGVDRRVDERRLVQERRSGLDRRRKSK